MGTRLASVGDTIRITSTISEHFEKVFTVIKEPEGCTTRGTMTWVWIVFDTGVEHGVIFYPGDYEIIDPESQPQDAKDVDKSMARQMDDNLKGVFG